MIEFIEYVKIRINANADLKELEEHLSMNGYDFGVDKGRNLLFVFFDEIDYVETILEDRDIEYEVISY